MPDYKAMYHILFHGLSQAIEALQAAHQAAEALYLESEEPEYQILETVPAEKPSYR